MDDEEEEGKKKKGHHHGEEDHPELEADWDSTSDQFEHHDFEKVLLFHDFTMVNFYADWCIHCRRFAPIWKEAEDETDDITFRDKFRNVVHAKLLRVNCVNFALSFSLSLARCARPYGVFLATFGGVFLSYIGRFALVWGLGLTRRFDFIRKIRHLRNIRVREGKQNL